MLIRPAHFAFNVQTAGTNSFQQTTAEDEARVSTKAIEEFDRFANTLSSHGLNVHIFNDTLVPPKPDAIFPNNWISFHHDGTLVLYPMCAANRRSERRPGIVELLKQQYTIRRTIDLSHFEDEGKFLEGTGSIVFDHDNKIAYAALSPRTNKALFIHFCSELAYSPVYFHAHDTAGQEIYHTNVLMCLAEKFCVLCTACIDNIEERELVLTAIRNTGRELLEISMEQMDHFAGNMLSVRNNAGQQLLVLSQTAFNSLSAQQKVILSNYATLLPIPIPTIETIGGGSTRCMIAEIFLPPR